MSFLILADIPSFFNNLYNNTLVPAIGAIGVFFFAWGAIGLMFPEGRNGEQAKSNLYRVASGIALAVLASTIAAAIQAAGK